MKALHGGRPVGTDLGAVTGPGREPGYRESGLSRRPRPRRRFAAADLAAAQRIAETDSRTLDRVMPTVSRLANRGFLGVYVDLVHARQELEGLLGRRGLGRRQAEVVGLIQVLRRSRPHELILDGRRLQLWMYSPAIAGMSRRGTAAVYRPDLCDGRLDVRIVEAGRLARSRLVAAVLTGTLGRYRA